MSTPASQNGVPNHWLRSIFALRDVSLHVHDAMAAAGIDAEVLAESGALVPRGTETAVLEFLSERLGKPYAGAEIGVSLDPHNSSLLTYILFNSNTLHEALHHVQHFTPVTRPRARIEIRESSQHVDLVVDGVGIDVLQDAQLIEFSLGALLGAMRVATGLKQPVIQVGLDNIRRRGKRDLSSIYGCKVELGAEANYLRFPTSALTTPIKNADAHLLDHLTSYGEVLLGKTPALSSSLSERIERHLLHGMASGRPRSQDTAAAFGLSERTMNRRLVEEGTSFRSLVSQAQLKLARAFLSDPRLSLAETAHLCGFADQSSFTQAYRRWTSRTPKADRISLINNKDLQETANGGISTSFDRNIK